MGLPVQQTEDGRLYKPLVAVLVEDLDGRLNLNAHGSNDQLAEVNLDPTSIGNLAQDYDSNPNQPGRQNQPVLRSTDQLAQVRAGARRMFR